MHKSGNMVYVSVSECFAMKTNEKMFTQFVSLSSAWITAKAFTQARKTKADHSEWKTWLTSGLWNAVQRADDRLNGVGMIYSLAWRDASKAYVAKYVNAAQKTEDACDSCNKNDDGGFDQIEIPHIDEDLHSLDFRDFMEKLESKLSKRDFIIISKHLNGYTFQEIGDAVGISKARAHKVYHEHLNLLREFA